MVDKCLLRRYRKHLAKIFQSIEISQHLKQIRAGVEKLKLINWMISAKSSRQMKSQHDGARRIKLFLAAPKLLLAITAD